MFQSLLSSAVGLFVLIVISTLYLLFGYRLWRTLMTLNGIGLGLSLGISVGEFFDNSIFTLVSVLVGAGIFGNIFYYGYRVLPILGFAIWAGAMAYMMLLPMSLEVAVGVGILLFLVAGFLTYKFFRPCLIISSALCGAVNVAYSIMMLLILKGATQANSNGSFDSLLKENLNFTLILWGVLFGLGVIYQFNNSEAEA